MKKEIQQTKDFYDTNAPKWAGRKTNSFYHQNEFEQLCTYLPAHTGSVIDIGCAWGIHVPLFLGIGRHLAYHGIDISESFLHLARRRYPQLDFTQGDIAERSSLPHNNTYDGFLAVSILMHLPFDLWDTAFHNIETLCAPGAHGYLTLPTAHPSGDSAKDDSRYFEILSAEEQRAYLASRNWHILENGSKDGFSEKDIWQWYIVALPE